MFFLPSWRMDFFFFLVKLRPQAPRYVVVSKEGSQNSQPSWLESYLFMGFYGKSLPFFMDFMMLIPSSTWNSTQVEGWGWNPYQTYRRLESVILRPKVMLTGFGPGKKKLRMVVSNMAFIFHFIWDVILTKLTNSTIFQDGSKHQPVYIKALFDFPRSTPCNDNRYMMIHGEWHMHLLLQKT